MRNEWAEPEGIEGEPTPIQYRILDRASGEVVDRVTLHARDHLRDGRYFYSLAYHDQEFANEIVLLVQQACTYFYASDEAYEPLESVPEVIVTDDEVRDRIRRLNKGENEREADRTHSSSYPLDELPWDQQRALIERIEQHKIDNHFEIIGPIQYGNPSMGEPDVGYEDLGDMGGQPVGYPDY